MPMGEHAIKLHQYMTSGSSVNAVPHTALSAAFRPIVVTSKNGLMETAHIL